jgi:hypothetical protein
MYCLVLWLDEVLFPVFSFFRRFRKIAKKRLLASSCLAVRLSAWYNSAPTGRIFMKFDIWLFFENMSRKFNFH